MFRKKYYKFILILILQIIIMSFGLLLQENNYFFNIKNPTSIDLFSMVVKTFMIMFIYFFIGMTYYELTINKMFIVIVYMQITKIIYACIWNFRLFGFIDIIIDNINRLDEVLHLIVFFVPDICFMVGIFITKYVFSKNIQNSIIYIFLKNIILINLCTIIVSIVSFLCFKVLTFFEYKKFVCIFIATIYSLFMFFSYFYVGGKMKSMYKLLIIVEFILLILIINCIQFLIPINLYYFIQFVFPSSNNIIFYYILSLIPNVAMVIGYLFKNSLNISCN